MGEFVRLEVDEASRVGTIRLDRPPVNALNAQIQEELRDAADQAGRDERVGAVVLWGGEKVFAAGADIKEMSGRSFAEMSSRATDLGQACDALARIPKVVIAAVNGYALGGGCEVALTADFRVAADDAKLGQPEILLGVIPGAGGTQRLPRLVGPSRAKEMVYSGRFYGAAECRAMGLVDEVHPAAEVYQRACEAAAGYAKGPGLALRAAKQVIDAGLEVNLDAGLALERQAFYSLFATEDAAEGMASFVANGPGKAAFRNR
ncbi:MAG TPA: enoyl-CoA hydratase-related protein [Actinomycetes bacterium]|nr:enoyl-CoA hydratase-related protein [Actinomycetes bacterium]